MRDEVKIHVMLEDHGQDLIEFTVDGTGVIDNCNLQQHVWGGKRIVNADDLTPGGFCALEGNRQLRYPIETIWFA